MSFDLSRVAILLATYNGALYIEEQLRSIQSQTHRSWHIFVRDDGSTDDTIQLLKQVLQPGSFTIIECGLESARGPAKNFFAILQAINLIEFDFIAFCDQDDIWAPRKLERAVECLSLDSAGGYSSNLMPFDNIAGRAWFLKKSYSQKKFDYLFQGASAGCTYVLNRKCAILLQSKVDAILLNPPDGFSHDWSIYAICRSFGENWVHDTQAYIFYRQHSLNAFGAMPSYRGLFERLRLARSGWYRNNIIWIGTLLSGDVGEEEVLSRVKRFNLTDRFWLARESPQFRRRGRDALLFALVSILGLL
jgi:rhamnosyltransferase